MKLRSNIVPSISSLQRATPHNTQVFVSSQPVRSENSNALLDERERDRAARDEKIRAAFSLSHT